MYCSLLCRDTLYGYYENKLEYWIPNNVIMARLNNSFDRPEDIASMLGSDKKLSVFDLNFNNVGEREEMKNKMICFYGLTRKAINTALTHSSYNVKLYELIAFESARIFQNNPIQLGYVTFNGEKFGCVFEGMVTALFGSLFNHSCNPNVERVLMQPGT
jgi:hypothetical protein